MDSGAENYRRFLDGDNDALCEIIRDYKDGLILYLNTIVGDIVIAEELCEDTFVRLGVKRPRFRHSKEEQRSERSCDDEQLQQEEDRACHRGRPRFKTWMYTIARNIAIDHLRKTARNHTVSIDECAELTDDECSLEESYIREENRITVHRTMARLKAEHRQVLWLVYFEEMSAKEAAAVMKKSVHATEMLIHRAKEALKRELESEGITV